MNESVIFQTKSPTFVDDALKKLFVEYNFSSDEEYSDLIESCVRASAVIAEFQNMTFIRSSGMLLNETRLAVLSGYVSHLITEIILARGYIEEIERKILEDVPDFPKSDLLAPQFDKMYPNLKGIRNTLEHSAERRRGLKSGRKPISNISQLFRPDGTVAKCGELVIFPPSVVKCHLSDGAIGEVDLALVAKHVGKLLSETIKRFPLKTTVQEY